MKIDLKKVLILSAVGVLGYSLVKGSPVTIPTALNPFDRETPPLPSTNPSTGSGTPAAAIKSVYPLKKGSKGDLVRALQVHLGIMADGVFGTQTENALLQQHGISVIYTANGYSQVMNGTLHANPPASGGGSTPAPSTPASLANVTAVFNAIYVYKQIPKTYNPVTKLPATYTLGVSMRDSVNWTVLKTIMGPLSTQINPAALAAFEKAFDAKYKAQTSLRRTLKNLPQTAYSLELPQLYAKMR